MQIADENTVRGQWRLAKIVQCTPSKDGLVRKVTVHLADRDLTKRGVRKSACHYLERPIHKVALLLRPN